MVNSTNLNWQNPINQALKDFISSRNKRIMFCMIKKILMKIYTGFIPTISTFHPFLHFTFSNSKIIWKKSTGSFSIYNDCNQHTQNLFITQLLKNTMKEHAQQGILFSIRNGNLHAKFKLSHNQLPFFLFLTKHAWLLGDCDEDDLKMIPPMTCNLQMTHPFFGMTDSHDTPRARDRTHRVLTQWICGSRRHSSSGRHLGRPPLGRGVTGIGWAHPICKIDGTTRADNAFLNRLT